MTAEIREAAAKIREDCPIPEGSRVHDFIDYPTGWAIQKAGVEHDGRCSAQQSGGALLCDCEAIYPAWREWRALLAVAELLENEANAMDAFDAGRDVPPYNNARRALLTVIALAYLGRSA